jgi:DNA polymerase
MSSKRSDADAVRRYLEEETAAGRGTLWEVVLSEQVRRGREGSTADDSPEKPVTVTDSPKPSRAAPLPAEDEPDESLLFDLPSPSSAGPGAAREGDTLVSIAEEVRSCTACGLCELRTNAVPGVGKGESGIVFVGEAPGSEEDRRGEPFVGRAGDLLTRILAAMDEKQLIPGVPINRDTVYICNVLKCRPPENRNPLPHEIESCSPYLQRQLAVLKPKVICCLGKFAAELMVGVKGTIASMRGKVYRYGSAKLLVTYHPAACLRNPGYKRPVWEDMQLLAKEYTTP